MQVITDPMTGRSKGFGFCRFGDETERDRAIVEMAGHFINNRPIRVSTATARKAPSVPYPPNPVDSKSLLLLPKLHCKGAAYQILQSWHYALRGGTLVSRDLVPALVSVRAVDVASLFSQL